MKTLLALSPHLDDAAFSISPLLAMLSQTHRVVVATPFAGSVANPTGFALACQLDKGLSPDTDYMKLRRREDTAWAQGIGAQVCHGNLTEAPHRGYHSALDLFSDILANDLIGPHLETWLQAAVADFDPELIVLPLGIGGHVDHLWVRKTAVATLGGICPLAFYCDQPYCAKLGLTPAQIELPETRGLLACQISLNPQVVEHALEATTAFVSQIPFQFGSFEKMRDLIGGAWRESLCVFSNTADHPTVQAIIHTGPNHNARS